jgi:ferredoxin-NADP reductase
LPAPITLPVRENLAVTRRARLLRLDLQGRPFAFRAGQAVLAGLHGQPVRRPYSIASAPEETARDGWLELLVQIEEDGRVPAHLPEGVGALMDVEGPIGSFGFPDDPPERSFLFVAGGTGIAPLRAMLHHALAARPDATIGVLYSARAADEFAYEEELRGLAARGRIRLRQTVTRAAAPAWTTPPGRIDRAMLASMLPGPETRCFVCGPESLVQQIPALLQELGVTPERIHTDEWAA